jgi:N-acetyl sugar amidotransferase
MTDRPYQICANCVMDTTDAGIAFDAHGVCDQCRNFTEHVKPNWHPDEKGWERLARTADKIRAAGKGRDFDCILGMSGGVDSSYLTYVAKEKMGLRPLVFHVDAGWNSDLAVSNIERVVEGLGLDLFTEVIDWDEMRDLQLAFFKAGLPNIDTPQDHAFFATMYKFAEKFRVKYILTGANISTECVKNPLEWMYYQSDSVHLRDVHRKHGTRPLDKFPLTSILKHKLWLRYIKGIEVIRPLDQVPFVKEEAIRLLAERFGWQKYPQKHFESRFTRFYEGYWMPRRFGYDTRRVQFSSLILTGQMSRAEALERLKQPAIDDETGMREFRYVASKLGITTEELQRYFEMPKRTYKDYRSQRQVYAFGSRAMKALGLERAIKR